MHRDLARAQSLQSHDTSRRVDLHHLAARLSEIAVELRDADVSRNDSGHHTQAVVPYDLDNPDSSAALIDSAGSTISHRAKTSFAPQYGDRAPHARDRTGTNTGTGKFVSHQHRRVINAEYAREAYHIRRRRTDIFGNAELFGEPAWDILLDLYIAYVENKPVSVSSACIGSAAPPTTGLRWLGILSENGFVLREHDPQDQRRVLVRLTERGLTAMDDYFASAGLSA